MLRAALYIRVSTAEQKIHGLSLEAQQAELDRWAGQAGVQVVGRYADPGVSARKKAAGRPGLQRMLRDVRAGKIDLIVFTKLDRWFRSVAEYYKVQEVLEQYHVNWKTTLEDYDTSTAAGRLKINIMLSVAQDEADRTGERIRMVFDAKRQRREPTTGSVPTGYRLEGKRMVRDEASEAAVEAFFRTYLTAVSLSEARAAARERGLAIGDPLARKMLGNPAYAGRFCGVEGMCPPYVTREEFDRIQSLRGRTARRTKEGRVYLFSGLAVCGVCGCRLGGRANSRGGVPFYNCPGHYGRKSCPNGVNLSERKMESQLLAALEEPLSRYEAEFRPVRGGGPEKGEIAAARRRLARLKELYLSGALPLDEYRADRTALERRLVRLSAPPPAGTDPARLEALAREGWQAAYRALEPAGRRDFWRCLLQEVRLYPDRHVEFDLRRDLHSCHTPVGL
ncbi:recombinase family protein [Dysosmobacter sp.]|uniref:recombinase family protein n=1 Tax=Dysosmobacter sp. TaxID=2591382 RepID=UPI002A899047|nr:recombinase family protein [Dysosmobacter sp.]MDY3281447.1 recombinase family protein [Dysosmobacter sp.]